MEITKIVEYKLHAAFNGGWTLVFTILVNIVSLVAGPFRHVLTKTV